MGPAPGEARKAFGAVEEAITGDGAMEAWAGAIAWGDRGHDAGLSGDDWKPAPQGRWEHRSDFGASGPSAMGATAKMLELSWLRAAPAIACGQILGMAVAGWRW